MKKEVKTNNKGFSLVELIVVVAIMAVLMVVLAPAMLRYVEKSRAQKDDSAVSELRNAVDLALAQDDVYNEANGATFTVTVAGSDGQLTFDSSQPKLQAEVEATMKASSGKIGAMSSNKRKSDTYTVTATCNATDHSYTVTGAWGTP